MHFKCKFDCVDCILKQLPEIHIKGYSYCGPNTDLERRLANGEPGINELDCACKEHDIAYSESKDLESRIVADKLLILKAIKRVYAKDARFDERFFALIVSGLISVKMFITKLEIYIRRLRNLFTSEPEKKPEQSRTKKKKRPNKIVQQ